MRSGHFFVLFPFVFAAQVAAHGYVKTVTIDDKAYAGNIPYRAPSTDSPIRLINDTDPVMGTDNVNLVCGQGAANAALVVSANPGSKVAFNWVSTTGGNWPHNTGPLMTYMALCEGTTCDEYDATNANWFKIDQAGQKSDGSGWWQLDIMQGKSYTVTLPAEIAPGDYLIRHEIIALQRAATLGLAEFYPSCTQVRVGGSGTGVGSPTVHFPGAYKEDDPGLYTPDVYQPGFVYQFPGPALAMFGGSGSGSNSSSVPVSTSTFPASSSSSVSVSTSTFATSTSASVSTASPSSTAPAETSTTPSGTSTVPTVSSTISTVTSATPTETATATTETGTATTETETATATSTVPITSDPSSTHLSTSARPSHTVSTSHYRSWSRTVSASHHRWSSHHISSTPRSSSQAVSTSLPSSESTVESTSTIPASESVSTSTLVPASSTVAALSASSTGTDCDSEWEEGHPFTRHPSWPHRMAKVKRSHF